MYLIHQVLYFNCLFAAWLLTLFPILLGEGQIWTYDPADGKINAGEMEFHGDSETVKAFWA